MSKLFLRDELIDDSLYNNLRYDLSSREIVRLCEKYLNGLYVSGVADTLFLYLVSLLKSFHSRDLYYKYYELISIRADKVDGIIYADVVPDARIVNCGMLSPNGIPNQFVYCKGYDCSCEKEYKYIRQYLEKRSSELPSCDAKKIDEFIKSSIYNPTNKEMYRILNSLTDGD